ncbi:gliding motility protein GldL [Weeksella virosa]|uniref:Gliding motility-associated protein GldL n=1 Tax=Weeksella virosa (strain ATCC 43766 / DSM 16922 / JCM 21250 / CCUG 30538 / CDC 9751 / IAM 14551 / NBRC 16016 / NCTC 11634 / CL345/78) TaxID=865938 RepID=F0NZE0_WEEVC|nr:gliding motility protein GldL [Weeksella virosa]ADX67269.1 gliding motility-associated protein GldL [Weeksella virosa DSM 16922]MDK7675550.1 gliding motility protein GldL [Weeksella virosa]SUP53550.1 gliding motility-associated protein GldL [Weeksella virosa]VEH62995.1 gliding motility-associated protein GldL [Weeksella virosa]
MAAQATKQERLTNFLYNFFAAVVIIGALCKITHTSPLGISANIILSIGLVAEALVFMYAAFFDKPSGEYDWEVVYPELVDGKARVNRSAQAVVGAGNNLTAELDKVLAEAKLDKEVFERLRTSLDKFGSAVSELNTTTSAVASTEKYGAEMLKASENISSLNTLYAQQIENSRKQVELNKQFIEEMQKSSGSSEQFLKEMQSLSENINALNKVYGGMLNAMRVNQ